MDYHSIYGIKQNVFVQNQSFILFLNNPTLYFIYYNVYNNVILYLIFNNYTM